MSNNPPQPPVPNGASQASQGPAAGPTDPSRLPPPVANQASTTPPSGMSVAPHQPQQAPRPAPPQSAAPLRPAPAAAPAQPGAFKRGFGLGAGAGLGVGAALLALSVASAIVLGVIGAGLSALAGGGGVATPQMRAADLPQDVIWGADGASKTLFAVDISGPIMTDASDGGLAVTGTYGYEVAAIIDSLTAEDADALVMLMNTPGGTVTGSKAISDAVARYKERTGKKVFAHVEGMSASGGMYAMAGADEIQADYGSMVGSIGVIFGPFERYQGVTSMGSVLTGTVTASQIEQFYLTAGRGKDAGNPFRDMSEEENKVFLDGLNNEYDLFVNHVATGRKIPADTIKNDLGAHIFDNEQAEAKGLIDGTMGRDQAFRRAAELAGVDPADTQVVVAAAPGLLGTLLGAEARTFGQSVAVGRTANGAALTTSAMCRGTATVLVYHGSLTGACS